MRNHFKNSRSFPSWVKAKRIRAKGRWLMLLLLLFLIFIFLSGGDGFLRFWSLFQEKKNLRKEVNTLYQEKVELLKQREDLIHNKTYIEKQAREQLGMAKEGEAVIKFIPEKADPKVKINGLPSTSSE